MAASRGAAPAGGLRIAVAGKGGAGKSVIAGTLARLLARRGHRVLVLDSDPMPGVALSLGAGEPPAPALLEVAERDERGRWRLRPGIGPVRAVMRCATPAPDGVRLLQLGKATAEGLAPVMGAVHAFYRVVHRLPERATFKDWTLIGDLPAGPRQAAARFAPYARVYLVVAQPGWPSALAARRVARIVRSEPGAQVWPVASRVRSPADVAWLEDALGEAVAAAVPDDAAIAAAERRGASVLDAAPGSPAVAAIAALADLLESAYPPGEVSAA